MGLEALWVLFVAAFILVIKPGPYMMMLISLASAGKWKSILSFWFGYFIAASIMYFFLLTTLSLLPPSFGIVFIFLKAIAAVIFVSMGLSGLKEKISDYEEGAVSTREKISGIGLLAKFGVGFMLAVSNPYDIVFIVTIIPSLVNQTTFSLMDIAIIRGIVASTDFVIHASYCIPLMFVRNFLNKEILQKLKVFASIAMIGIGIYIFINLLLQWDLSETNLISSLTQIVGV